MSLLQGHKVAFRTTYVRHMIVELQVMIHDRMIDMIELEKVFQCPSSLFVYNFDVVHLDRRDIDCWSTAC